MSEELSVWDYTPDGCVVMWVDGFGRQEVLFRDRGLMHPVRCGHHASGLGVGQLGWVAGSDYGQSVRVVVAEVGTSIVRDDCVAVVLRCVADGRTE